MKNENKNNRRSFLGKLIKAAAGVFVLQSFSLKTFADNFSENKKPKVKVKIHPSAVKRNK